MPEQTPEQIAQAIQARITDWDRAARAETAKQASSQNLIEAANADSFKKAIDAGVTWAKQGPLQTVKALIPGATTGNPISDIWESAKATAGIGYDVASHIAHQANSMLQAVSPMDLNKIPGMSGVFPEQGQGVVGRTDQLVNSIPIVSDLAKPFQDTSKAFEEDVAKLGSDATLGAKLKRGAAPAIAKGFGPLVSPIKQLMTGKDDSGQPLDPYSATQAVEQTAMLVAPGLSMLKGVVSEGALIEALEGKGVPKELKVTHSIGEEQAAQEIKAIRKEQNNQRLVGLAKAQRKDNQIPSDSNVTSGGQAVPLNEAGLTKAQELVPALQGLDKIYSSPTLSAQQTARVIGASGTPSEEMAGLRAPNLGHLEGQPEAVGGPLFDRAMLESPEAPIPGQGSLNSQPGEAPAAWAKDFITSVQGLQKSFTDSEEFGPKIGAITHGKNLELLQAYADKGGQGEFDLQDYLSARSGPPGSLYHFAPDYDGLWKLQETDKVGDPGLYFVRHPETDLEGSQGSGEANIGQATGSSYEKIPWDNLPESLTSQFDRERLLTVPQLQDIHTSLISNNAARAAIVNRYKLGDPFNVAASKVLTDPEIMKPIISDLVDTRGASFAEAQSALVDSYHNTSENFGQTGGEMSSTLRQLMDHFDYIAKSGNYDQATNAMKILKDLRQASETAAGRTAGGVNLGPYSKVANILQKTERLRIASMLTPLRTAVGIAQSQFGLVGTDFMDGAFTALANGFSKPLARLQGSPQNTSTNALGDLTGLSQSVISRLNYQIPGGVVKDSEWLLNKVLSPFVKQVNFPGQIQPNNIDSVLAAVPPVGKRLMQGLLYDTDAHMLGQSMTMFEKGVQEKVAPTLPQGLSPSDIDYEKTGKALTGVIKDVAQLNDISLSTPGKGMYNIAKGITDLLLIPNRFQETQFRKLAFEARYRSNLSQIGMSWDDAIQELNRKEILKKVDPETGKISLEARPISPELRESIVDAEIHALRQTYAYNPEGGLFGALLRYNQYMSKVIPTSMVGLTFPRAIVNNVLWQVHHSPAGIADILTPEYRDAFLGIGDKMTPLKSYNASRKIGEAMTGVMLMTTAMHMANGGSAFGWSTAGKPWLLQHDTEKDSQGNPLTHDISNLQPANNIWTIADFLMAYANGRPPRAQLGDAIGQILNVKGGNAPPIFDLSERLRNLDSPNDETLYKSLTTDLGSYLGGFAPLLQGLREEYAAVPPQFRSVILGGQPNNWLNLDTKVGFARKYQHDALPDAMLAPIGSSQTVQRINPATGQAEREEEPNLNLAHWNRRLQTPFERILAETPGEDINKLVKSYEDPHATMLVRQELGKLLWQPDAKLDSDMPKVSLQNIAMALEKLNAPAVSKLFIDRIKPELVKQAEENAIKIDAAANGGKPIHFVAEAAKKVNQLKQPDVQRFIEDLLRAPKGSSR